MFEAGTTPRIFATAPGVDFAAALVAGLLDRAGGDPTALARVQLYVNTARMQRRIRALFDQGPARLLPRINLITDLADDPGAAAIPPAVPPLQRRLEIARFVATLIAAQPDLAPRAALYDLADSLARLMDEMQGEGVSPDVIAALDVSDQSGHWDRALQFLRIIAPYFNTDHAVPDPDPEPDREARQRRVVTALAARWQRDPPVHPVIIAGSTGSRGTTALFMQAVAALPQGAIVLPGYDFDLPDQVWTAMDGTPPAEDHPQYRFRALMHLLGFSGADVRPWANHAPPHPERNRLISLSLRPAPVTDQWLYEGRNLGDLRKPMADVSLIEAASPRAEAEVIALRLRQAAEDGETAALISPDRMLTRQVTAALDRWGIVPDDSAGLPLVLSPPGRFLRQVADLFGRPLTGAALLALLNHPLCHSGRADRGDHLRWTRMWELHLREKALAFPVAADLQAWAAAHPGATAWANWLAGLIGGLDVPDPAALALPGLVARHLTLACGLAAGPDATGAGRLWADAAGREARMICDHLSQAAPAGGAMTAQDYTALFAGVMADGTVRNPDTGHPGIVIWGTLEARVQGADLMILGGMNDGIWPEAPPPDPWLNRQMRLQAGLLLPERQIGLSAHDYQQAVAGKKVWITRATRDASAQTVPSRWINRLANLLQGLPDQQGPQALAQMRARGAHWCAMAGQLGVPTVSVAPAARPSPCPPTPARPDRLSVTGIKTLIRNPYAIYAQSVLRLRALDPLVPGADAPLRGVILHKILERFIRETHAADDRAGLMQIAGQEMTARCPWPATRAQWLTQFDMAADRFLQAEALRRTHTIAHKVEIKGEMAVAPSGVTVVAKADRIDLTDSGAAFIYDYKTGQVPTKAQQMSFDKQLLVTAAMLERGAFADLGPLSVVAARFVGVGVGKNDVDAPLNEATPDAIWEQLEQFLAKWQSPTRGYTARMALFSKDEQQTFDHLSRYGEWDISDLANPVILT